MKKIPVLAALLLFMVPLAAAELKAAVNVNNYYDKFLPGLTFSWEQTLGPYFHLNVELFNENYTQHYFSSAATFFSPRLGGFGLVLGLGTLYTFSSSALFPGVNAVVGVRFPNDSLLSGSFGAIINPENIFSTLEYIAQAKYEFGNDAQQSEVIFKYDRQRPDDGGMQQYFALKFHSRVFNEQRNFSLSLRAGMGVELLQQKLDDLMIFGRVGGAWHTRKTGSYGLFFDVFQPVMSGQSTKIAIGFEYGIKF